MLFNSIPFLIFLPLFLIGYFLSKNNIRLIICLSGSYLFYAWWDWRFLFLIVFITGVNYQIGLKLGTVTDENRRRILLAVSVVASIGLLCIFKYTNFFITSFIEAIGTLGFNIQPLTLNIILPVGISFYTFKAMSYTIDVYRRQLPPEKNFIVFATYIAFFPQLLAGPIVRAKLLLPQLKQHFSWDLDRFVAGMEMIVWGFVLKVAVADSLAPVVNRIYSVYTHQTSLALIIATFFFSFQIYCDFNGYSSIAIGIGKILGYDFGINFNRPYFAHNFSQFWERWHISLSSWFRDFLYIPLGGNRFGRSKTFRNLMLTMFLAGLWHGAQWTFVFWGLLHGVYLIGQRFLGPYYAWIIEKSKLPDFISKIILISIVFILTCVAWIFFRADSIEGAFFIIHKIFSFDCLDFRSVPGSFLVVRGFFLIFVVVVVELISLRPDFINTIKNRPFFRIAAFSSMLYVISLFGNFGSNVFIYFQF